MRSYRRMREGREPDKTPLIDVVFLLLIFFFVSLATASFVDVGERRVPKREESLDWLAEMPNVPDLQDTSFYLVQVRRIEDMTGYDFALMDSVMDELSSRDLDEFAVGRVRLSDANPHDFAVLICEGCNDLELDSEEAADRILKTLEELEKQDAAIGEIRDAVAGDAAFLPYVLPRQRRGRVDEDAYQRVKNAIQARLMDANEDKDVHLRFDEAVYYKFVFDMLTFFKSHRIPAEYVNFRVLSDKIQ